MACEISIKKGEVLIFSTEYFNFSRIEELKTLFLLLDRKFPEKQGFDLTVMRYPRYMPAINRWDFRTACASDDWRDPLKLFVLALEFVAFRQSGKIMNLDEAYYHIDNLKYHIGLSAVHCYDRNMAIFEITGEPTLFKIWGHVEFESNNLQEMEYELYLSFLKYHDPFPNP